MKKIIYPCLLVLFFSCSKQKVPLVDFSLLTQYNWQSIEHPAITTLDGKQVIPYSDTSFYSFNGQTFTTTYQAGSVSFIVGTDGSSYQINQVTGTWNGQYKINESDTSITFSGTRHLTVYDHFNSPGTGRDSVFTETRTAKVLLLNSSTLKIKLPGKDPVYLKEGDTYVAIHDNPDFPYIGGRIFTFNSVKK